MTEPRARSKAGVGLRRRVPHYRQTTDFTCGPSSCLMAMRAMDPKAPLDRAAELQLWREANTIFMGPSGGHGGCGALGLALALHRRGFAAEVALNHREVLLGTRTRSKARSEVMRVLQQRDLAEAKAARIPIRYRSPDLGDLEAKFREGWLPIVLCSTFYIHGDRVAHWVVVTGFDATHVFVNDPWVALDKGKSGRDMTDYPVPRADFMKMTVYGAKRERACVFAGPRRDRRGKG